jgi:hypothetical protein
MATVSAPPDAPYRTTSRKLPLLDDIRVAAPCHVSWSAMRGNGRVRECGQCEKQVFNVEGMTRGEAELLLLERADGVCVRFYRRDDGTILTSDCLVGVRLRHKVRIVRAVLTTALLTLLGMVGLKQAGTRVEAHTMGAVCVLK